MGKKRMTQPSISVPQDNVTKAKTIIEGVTVSVLVYSQFGNLWFVWTIGCNAQLLNFTNHKFSDRNRQKLYRLGYDLHQLQRLLGSREIVLINVVS